MPLPYRFHPILSQTQTSHKLLFFTPYQTTRYCAHVEATCAMRAVEYAGALGKSRVLEYAGALGKAELGKPA